MGGGFLTADLAAVEVNTSRQPGAGTVSKIPLYRGVTYIGGYAGCAMLYTHSADVEHLWQHLSTVRAFAGRESGDEAGGS